MLRAAGVGVVGFLAAAYGLAAHLPSLALGRASVAHAAGALLGLAGLAVLVWAVHAAVAGRGWRGRLAAAAAGVVVAQVVVVPVVGAGLAVNADADDPGPASGLGLPGAHDVVLRTADGVLLRAWEVPGRLPSAVVVVHGAHGSRADVAGHVRALSRAGLHVLALDARGHGASGGATNALGWRVHRDVAAAVRFLRAEPGLDRERIGVLGLSMGGEAALRAAARGLPVAAVVADGAGASTAADQRLVEDGPVARLVTWMAMRATELLSNEEEPPALVTEAARIRVSRVLLIASDADGELEIDRRLAREIGPAARLWHVSGAGHTEAFARHPAAYVRSVLAVLSEGGR